MLINLPHILLAIAALLVVVSAVQPLAKRLMVSDTVLLAVVGTVLGGGAALIPSSKKRGGPGAPLDIPLGHKDAAFVRSHFDGMEVRVNDAPRAGEIMVAVAVTAGGRPLPRVGGLTVDGIKGEDGLR